MPSENDIQDFVQNLQPIDGNTIMPLKDIKELKHFPTASMRSFLQWLEVSDCQCNCHFFIYSIPVQTVKNDVGDITGQGDLPDFNKKRHVKKLSEHADAVIQDLKVIMEKGTFKRNLW